MIRQTGSRAVDLQLKFEAFVTERYPMAVGIASDAFAVAAREVSDAGNFIAQLRRLLEPELRKRLRRALPPVATETTPGVSAVARYQAAVEELVTAADDFLRRAAARESLTAEERREILRGMLLTRATDNRLKTLFTAGDVHFGDAAFQGKGFRSLGQEAIYAAGVRLRRGERYREGTTWQGDVIAPMIRDLGVVLAMHPSPETIRVALSAQAGKAGPPMNGKDFHLGDLSRGILPPAAPLAIGALNIAGMAMAFRRQGTGRVALSFIGEGGTSLGEWHEAINLCAARRLPAVFCVQNNQTALSTPVADQSAVRMFADKAIGYGIPGVTIDGTDPDDIAAAFAWAVDRARDGEGPTLIELLSMRMCGHAHHDDMLYLGKDFPPSWEYPVISGQGYVNKILYEVLVHSRSDRTVCLPASRRRNPGPRRAGCSEARSRGARRRAGATRHRRAVASR